ncbi:MAG TPA: N-acetyl-alpha-D-glucosaminyl L-malate synthase BshA [Trueperaceae bacterium]|nr:N-acetyl-alpha-D-glucosaminyl L-malate synthase BshA [Trueperaceae bacterium]
MNIAVLLHSGAGGSGVAATELGLSFARAGHGVHFVADRVPFRLTEPDTPNVYFHQVESMTYPLFDAPLTTLAEASRLAEVVEEVGIDVVHAHYAVPHATAAILARDMVRGGHRPVVVTTLHGTDVTLVGLDRAYLRTTQYSIEHSDLVLAVSRYLADYTNREMGVRAPIRVIPNAVDHERFRPAEPAAAAERRRRFAHPDEKLLVHISNFRPVKRVEDVVRVFERVSARIGARLLMVGDGPDRPAAVALAAELGLTGRVSFLGSFPRIEDVLAVSDLFLLPSVKESFGLSALEAMASGVPVIASRIGGLPEVVEDGVDGILCPPGEVEAMAEAALSLLTDDARHAAFATRARERAVARFSEQRVMPQVARAYEDALRAAVAVSGR